jgi:O-antigen ligase
MRRPDGNVMALVAGIAVLAAAGLLGLMAGGGTNLVLLLPVVAAGGLVLLIHPVVGVLLLAGTIPLEAALMIEGASAPRLVGVAVFGAWGVQKLVRREPLSPLLQPGLAQIAALFLALACLSLLWAEFPQGVERRLFLLFQLILLSILILDLASSWERLAWIAKMLVVAATVAALLTLEQYYLGGARRAGAGIVGGINRTAVTLVAILPFAFYLLRSSETRIWRFLGLAYIGMSGVAVAATLSRMNFLMYPTVVGLHLFLMARSRPERARVLILGFVTAVVILAMPMEVIRDRTATIAPYIAQTLDPDDSGEGQSGRGFHLRIGLEIFKDHPILGAGYQNYNPQFLTYQWELPGATRIWQSPRSPHSSHVGILANLGIVGFALWLALFGLAFKYLWTAARMPAPHSSTQVLLSQSLAIAVGLQFAYGIYSEIHQGKIFWLIIGMTLAVWRLSRESPVEMDMEVTQGGDIPHAGTRGR